MPSNDLLLLNSIIGKTKGQYGSLKDEGEVFEIFVFDNVLKNFDLSLEELEDGWVDGSDDGGVDGIFIFIDGVLLTDDHDLKRVRAEPTFDIYVFTVKSADTFKQAALNSLIGSLPEIFSLAKDKLTNPYPDQLLLIRERFKEAYIALADKTPSVNIHVLFCSKGSTAKAAKNILTKVQQLELVLRPLFSRSNVEVKLLGAGEILTFAQKQKRYSLKLPYTESFISRDANNYVVLCRLRDYLDFITDEEGGLRRYLFEGNVRDYLGDVQVNENIAETLRENGAVDFWWLNNGVTILASSATVVGKAISIENVLIVNGLQTTETIYRTLNGRAEASDERAVLIKVIISTDDDVRARIIKATNYQNSVELASLRSLDQLHKNIEHYLLEKGWFYERRNNYYRNQSKPGDRILTIGQLGAAVRALAFKTPRTAQRRQKWLRDDNSYKQVFNSVWPLDLFLACAKIVRSIEIIIKGKKFDWREVGVHHKLALNWKLLIALVIACKLLKNVKYDPPKLAELASVEIDESEVVGAIRHIVASKLLKGRLKFAISLDDEQKVVSNLAENKFNYMSPTAEEFKKLQASFPAPKESASATG